MKTVRTAIALYLYERLLAGQPVNAKSASCEFALAPATFKRAVSEIRCYLAEHHPEEELIYHKKEDTYRLESVHF